MICENCQDNCCKRFSVTLSFQEYLGKLYKTKRSGLWEGDKLLGIVFTLKRDNNACVYLNKNGFCSIYSQRPQACRNFPCDRR